MKLHDGIML